GRSGTGGPGTTCSPTCGPRRTGTPGGRSTPAAGRRAGRSRSPGTSGRRRTGSGRGRNRDIPRTFPARKRHGLSRIRSGSFGTGRAARFPWFLVPHTFPEGEPTMAERAIQPARGDLWVHFDAHHCRPTDAEYDKMRASLDALALLVENFPQQDLRVLIEFNS